MKEQLIQEVQRQMLPYLNNAQLKQLQGVLEGVLSGVELSHSAGMVESAKVDMPAQPYMRLSSGVSASVDRKTMSAHT